MGSTLSSTDGQGPDSDSEVAASPSGGGFSNYFPRHPYQQDVVPNFLQQLRSQYAGVYSAFSAAT